MNEENRFAIFNHNYSPFSMNGSFCRWLPDYIAFWRIAMTRAEIEKYIAETYGATPEYPWLSAPRYAVYRHGNNRKWFAVVMDIPKNRLGIACDEIADVLNLKCDPLLLGALVREAGIFPAYHMHKGHWISVLLEDVPEEQIKFLLGMSFELTEDKKRRQIAK